MLPDEIVALTHGEPRTRKSWAALELAIALTSGRPAFGLERFAIAEQVPVLYLSREDGARSVRARMKRLLGGYGIGAPEKLAFAIHRGIDLDNHEWQERLIVDVKRHGFKLLVFDPIRRFSAEVDKGPAEVSKITAFLRRLVIATGASVIINHHDVKPGAEKADTRRRSHKASGGDWFAASECPIAFETAGENCSLVIPEDYKFSVDPKPFTFRRRKIPNELGHGSSGKMRASSKWRILQRTKKPGVPHRTQRCVNSQRFERVPYAKGRCHWRTRTAIAYGQG